MRSQRTEWRIGTEHEKFPFLTDTLEPVPYEGHRSIKALLEGLQRPLRLDRRLRGRQHHRAVGPQWAWAMSRWSPAASSNSPARRSIPCTTPARRCMSICTQVREVGDRLGIGFLGLGASPIWTPGRNARSCPRAATASWRPTWTRWARTGRDMMFRTCTVQVNLDFGSEADMVKKLRVSLALQPIATALFANSPFLDGKPNGFLSFRSEVWRDTDNAPHRHAALRLRGRHRLRALCRLCPRRADVFRDARRQIHQRRGRELPRLPGRQACRSCPARSR